MKTAISVPDEVYADAERLARRLNRTRSRLFTEAVREYLARHDPERVTEALDRLYKTVDSRTDPGVSAASHQLLRQVEW